LFAESNKPIIIVPENETLDQLTLIKNTVFKNQTSTNVTYEIRIEVINSGDSDLTNIDVIDTDIDLDTTINLTEGSSWQASDIVIVQKEPQPYTKNFSTARASSAGNIFYSNQPSAVIPGYGGPYDVVIVELPGTVSAGSSFNAKISIINQNTEVEEDRTLTTVLKDADGNINDIDVRTVFIEKNDSLDLTVTLTAPSSPGTYYVFSELVWPTASASATKSFIVYTPTGGDAARAGEAGGAGQKEALCGDSVCESIEYKGGRNECIEDCGYDCDEDRKFESWAKCAVSPIAAPEQVKEDLIILINKANSLEKEIEALKQSGASTAEAEAMLDKLKSAIASAEESIARGEYNAASNIIRNAFVSAATIITVQGPAETAVTKQYAKYLGNIPWKPISTTIVIVMALSLVGMGIYYRYESIFLSSLIRRRHRLEKINNMIDKTIDNIYGKKGGKIK
jgi:hypothetical protein